MQLATAQAHQARAPPVPPRPSRQIVAEALKKSPQTPPCPTRQAPAPPINQRPWKNQPHQKATDLTAASLDTNSNSNNSGGGGRTLVYDSSSRRSLGSSNGHGDNKSPEQDDQRRASPLAAIVEAAKRSSLDKKPTQRLGSDRIDDTSKRKGEKENESNNSSRNSNKVDKDNNNNKDDKEDKDETDRGDLDEPAKEEDSCEAPKKKPQHAVTFKERNEDTSTSSSSDSATTQSTKILGAKTVVVIEDASSNNNSSSSSSPEPENIHTQDWLEAGIRYTSTKITLPAAANETHAHRHHRQQLHRAAAVAAVTLNGYYDCTSSAEFADLDFSRIIDRINMSSLPGLPPLPRSLSGFGLDNGLEPGPPPLPPARVPSRSGSNRLVKTPSSTSSQGSRPSPQGGRQLTTLDTQLSILRREMFGLRQLDLSLLSQLWSLNESIQEFRQLLQDQEDRAPSPSPSSDDGDDSQSVSLNFSLNHLHHQQQQQQQQPPPPPRRPAPAPPIQQQYHHQQQQQQHHYRSARSRNSITSLGHNLPNSDDSPSSEEYGAV